MDIILKEKLIARNNKIINMVLDKINNECPGCVDLIGIAGSFCNGDIYEKSDLDLVIIINDDKGYLLSKCFILDDIGYDIYCNKWNKYEEMSNYDNPYVTKLIDLDIVYTKDNNVINKYRKLQEKLKANMNNDLVNKKISNYYQELTMVLNYIMNSNELSLGYRYLAKYMEKVEYILYMLNRTYVKKGVKRVIEELSMLDILPNEFINSYSNLCMCTSLGDIKDNCSYIFNMLTDLLCDNNIDTYIKLDNDVYEINEEEKECITQTDIIGTYEEIYSNWYNKMKHAVDINNSYLSFRTMASCQEFYDYMSSIYEIENIELIGNYNPYDLESNYDYFVSGMRKWKQLYNILDLKVAKYDSLEDLAREYTKVLNNNRS